MIDAGIPNNREEWPAGVLDGLSDWEQGDIVASPPLFYFADPALPVWAATRSYMDASTGPEIVIPSDAVQPPYGLVTSQTCDIAEFDSKQPMRPWVQIAPVYEVTNKGWKKKLKRGGGKKYWLHVPELDAGKVWAADLRIEVPVEKSWLSQQRRFLGLDSEEEKLRVAERLAWIRGRPAFSSDFNETILRSLSEVVYQLDEVGDDDKLSAEYDEKVVEIVAGVDSLLAPTTAQVVVVTQRVLSDAFKERLQGWWDEAVHAASDAGISLQPTDFRGIDEMTVAEYRRFVPLL